MVLVSVIIPHLLIIYLTYVYTNMDLVKTIMDNKYRRKESMEIMEKKTCEQLIEEMQPKIIIKIDTINNGKYPL